jgi:hypothetical protein
VRVLPDFVRVFAEFWASDGEVIRRLPGLGTIDSEIGQGLRARNERRRRGARVIVERYGRWYPPLTPLQEPIAIDTLHMLTSFETFDALAVDGRTLEEVIGIIQKMADRAIGFTPRSFLGARSAPRSDGYMSMNTSPFSTLKGYVFSF